MKNKWKEVTIQTVRKSISQWKKRLNAVRKRNRGAIQHIFANCCDWISIACSETCWPYWLLCPRPVIGVRRPSVRLMSRTSALTRKPKGLGRRKFAQGYPRLHATPKPTSMSKGQKSRSRGGGILWRPPSRTACFVPFGHPVLFCLFHCQNKSE